MKLHARHFGVIALILVGALLLQVHPVLGQGTDPMMGNWTMDLAKSQFDPAAVMTKRTMTITPAAGGGFHCAIDTYNANGEVNETAYNAAVDGKEHSTPELAVSSVTFTKVDANTIQRTGTRDGKQVETYTIKFSNGGKTMTITVKGTDPMGADYSSTQVYFK